MGSWQQTSSMMYGAAGWPVLCIQTGGQRQAKRRNVVSFIRTFDVLAGFFFD